MTKTINGIEYDVLGELFYANGEPAYRLVESMNKRTPAVQYYGLMNQRWVNTCQGEKSREHWDKLVSLFDNLKGK